jgi:hypothetical protein
MFGQRGVDGVVSSAPEREPARRGLLYCPDLAETQFKTVRPSTSSKNASSVCRRFRLADPRVAL